MLIALTDPIWNRLYGPYGIEDVAGRLVQLSREWDETLALDLFWEKLHHQETLYPVTFAALPWLWEIAGRDRRDRETLMFLSHVLFCVALPEGGASTELSSDGNFQGLSLRVQDHRHAWLPADRHLTASDMPALRAVEQWFCDHRDVIAETCLDAVAGADDYAAAALTIGYCCHKGSFEAANLMMLCADGHEPSFAAQTTDLSDRDITVLKDLYDNIHLRNERVALFLRDILGWSLPDPNQIELPLPS